jgi:hypothetical protein
MNSTENPIGTIDTSEKKDKVAHLIICVSLVALALLIRAPGLGKWCFAVDEYYFSRSVSFILENGIPEFPSGGYYTRGIALQYLTAGASLLFEKPEFAARVVPLVFGVLSIPLFFILCRLFLPLLPALLCSVILLVSSWHIEFSRFARMYAPFQFIFFAFLYAYYKGYWRNIRTYQKFSWILAFLSVFFYEGSIFLPAVLFIVFIRDEGGSLREKKPLGAVLIVLLLLNLFVIKIGFRNMGVDNALPPDLTMQTADILQRLPVVMPKLTYFIALWKVPLFAILYLFILGIAFYLYFKSIYDKGLQWSNLFSLIPLTLLILHQFGLFFTFMLVLMITNNDVKNKYLRLMKIWTLLIIIFLLFWTMFGFFTKDLWFHGQGSGAVLKGMVKIMFLYPPFHTDIIIPFVFYTPMWSFFALILIAVSTIHVIAVNRDSPSLFLLMIIVVCTFLISILKKPFHETRYFFFFYPLLYVIAFVECSFLIDGVKRLLNRKTAVFLANGFILIPLFLFFATEDFNLEQVRNVSSKEMNFRMGRYTGLASHWYPRADFETPAQYVNEAYVEGDIVVIDYSPISQYLEIPFINYLSPDHARFKGEARKEGREQIWTGRPLIYDVDTLVKIVTDESHESLWLISIVQGIGGGSFVKENYPVKIGGRYNLNVSLEYVGIDGRIGVWRFQRK